MATPRKPLQNVLWLVGERIGRSAVTATVLAVVARHLEPVQFGQLNLALAVLAILAPLATLGLEGVVVAELVRQPGRTGAVLATACWLRFAAGLLAVGIVALAASVAPAGFAERPLIAIVALNLLFQPAEIIDLWFQSRLDSRRTVLARSAAVLLGSALKLWLAHRGASVAAFAWAQVVDGALFAIALAISGARFPERAAPWRWDAAIARTLGQRGWPLAVAQAGFVLASRCDQFLVRAWLGERPAGIYFAATRLSEVAVFAGMATALSLFPALAASQQRSPDEYREKLRAVFETMSALGWIVALGGTLFAAPAVALLYGPGYAGAASILVLQCWACLFTFNGNVRWQLVVLSHSTALNLATAAVHLAVVVAVTAWLVPRLGAAGAAVGSLAAAAVSCYATTFVIPTLRPCAGAQTRGLLVIVAPGRWKSVLGQLRG